MVLVHGVDISTLEGWMIKINSNPSMFGKSTNRRWFKVSFVPVGKEEKLVISYSTNKTAKEPRGWLYIEDVSGVYCRREMIEVISPARTLRFKGETAVEHRLWSDSLHRLCNPPKSTSTEEEEENMKRNRSVAEAKAHCNRQTESEKPKQQDQRQKSVENRDQVAEPKKMSETAHNEIKKAREPSSKTSEDEDNRRRQHGKERDEKPSRRRHDNSVSDDDDDDDDGRHRRNRHSEEDDESDEHLEQSNDENSEHEDVTNSARDDVRVRRNSIGDEEPIRKIQQTDTFGSSMRRHSGNELNSVRDRSPLRAGVYETGLKEERSDRNGRRQDDTDGSDDSDEDSRTVPALTNTSGKRTSMLVAQIKSSSPFVTSSNTVKHKNGQEEDEDSDDDDRDGSPPRHVGSNDLPRVNLKPTQPTNDHVEVDHDPLDQEGPEAITPRDDRSSSSPAKNLVNDESDKHEVVDPYFSQKKKKNTEYFDSDDEDDEESEVNHRKSPNRVLTKSGSEAGAIVKGSVSMPSEIACDDKFVEEDWDAEEENNANPVKQDPVGKSSPEKRGAGYGGVTADANWVSEDWDD